MFRKAKNIDTAFRQVKLTTLVIVAASMLLCLFVIYRSYEMAEAGQSRIYVLGNGKALEAYASHRKDNIAVEAREHIRRFHEHFFTLAPDDRHIQASIGKALYLADNSAKRQYDNLKEQNYYTGIVSGNISQEIITDSIAVDFESIPYRFVYRGRQEITRPTSVVIRSLVCEGALREVRRSENNPHGFLIERWKITENKDLSIKNR